MPLQSGSPPFLSRHPGMTGAGLGRLPCFSPPPWTSSRFLRATLLTARVVTAGSGISIGAGGATAFATALAFARALTTRAESPTAATNGCCGEGDAGAAWGRTGAGLAFTTGGAGGAAAVPFDVAAWSAVAAAEAVATSALLPMLFRTPEAAKVPWSIRRPTNVLISPPARALNWQYPM